MPKTAAIAATDLFAAFAEPVRLRLLCLLHARGETCVCDLHGALRVPQPTASRHLAVLRRAGLVEGRKDGLWVWYSLAPARSKLHAKLLEALAEGFDEMPQAERDLVRAQKLDDANRCC